MTTCLPEFNTEKSGVCRGCALVKYTKTTFPSSDIRSKGAFDFIQSDLCGLMSSSSLIGFEYYIAFIDDYSKNTWIYFIKSKNSKDVLKSLQGFKYIMENQTWRNIRLLILDNGGEYTS